MEVAPCAQEARNHATSLLASLSLQREQAQFCDCVLRQRQNPAQLHPAHRCVLAASSPVLASLMSSTGALVELQTPCLSDSVLALILDYMYTGTMPYSHRQHQYRNLLTAACYLQMDGLQEALKAWQQTEVNEADNPNVFSKYLPLSMETEEHPYSANVNTCDDIDPCRSSSKNVENHCSRKDASTLSNVSTCCSISESTKSSVNTGNCRQVPQDLIKNIPCTTEVHRVAGEDKAHSAGTGKPDTWQGSADEELERAVEDRRRSNLLCTSEVQEEETSRTEKMQRLCLTMKSKAEVKQTNRKEEDKTQICHSPLLRFSTSHKDKVSPSQCSSLSSLSSPHSCCGTVTVIRHSSRAAMLQLAEVAPINPYHLRSQSSVSSNRAPDSPSGSTDSDSTVDGTTTRQKHYYGAQNQAYRNNKDQVWAQSWDYKDSSAQSHTLKQDHNSSNTDLIVQNGEHMSNGLSHITDHNDRHGHCDSFKNETHTKQPRNDSMPQNRDCSEFSRGLKYKTDHSFDDFHSKHPRLDCSDCHNFWMATAAEEQSIHSQDLSAAVPLPGQDSDTGSDSHCEDLCSEGETKEEHSSSRCPAGTARQDSHCDLYGPKTDWYPNLHRAEKSTKDAATCPHVLDSVNRDTAMTDKIYNVRQPVSPTAESCLDSVTGGVSGFKCCTSMELEKMPGTEITEPHLTFKMLAAHNMSDPTCSVVGPSYRGHLQYHLTQEETHLAHGYAGHKHSHTSHPETSDQSTDEEEAGTFASRDYNSLMQHFATGTTDQVLLLDISAKPAELLVANALRQTETFGNGFGNNDREQLIEEKSVAGVDTKYWVGGTNVEERTSFGKDQSRPVAEVIHKAGVEGRVSKHKEDENQTTTSMQDSVQASMSSTLSICIPSTLSASRPTDTSAHLSKPVHNPFQCTLCDRSFSQRGSLNRHVRSHLGVRPFPCPHCPMTFSRQYRVTEHMRVHQRCIILSDFRMPPASQI